MFTSEDGYTFVWKTNSSIKKHNRVSYKDGSFINAEYVPNKIKGTISAFEEYNGTKQTVLKRCEVCSVILKSTESKDIIDEKDPEIESIY